MDRTQDRLSSGYKVNSAMDSPSSYFTSQALNSRAGDLSTLLDSIGQAISTLETADLGITTLQDYVEQAKSVANSARDTANVPASVSSTIKFDTETLRSELVTNQVNGLVTTPGSESSMTVRVGDSTKLTGTVNVNEDTNIGTTAAPVNGLGLTMADAGSISFGGEVFNINASGTTDKMVSDIFSYAANAEFEVVELDSTDPAHILAAIKDKDGNVFRGIDIGDNTSGTPLVIGEGVSVASAMTITQTITSDGRTVATPSVDLTGTGTGAAASVDAEGTKVLATYNYASGTDFTITAASGNNATIATADGNSFDVTLTNAANVGNKVSLGADATFVRNADGSLTVIGTTLSDSGSAGGASGAATAEATANTVYIDNSGTVEKMAETIQNMIGNTKISVSVEDSNLEIKSLDTSAIEVTGAFANVFGLDTGTTIHIEAADTAESLRQKIAGIDGVTAEFDKDGHMVVKSSEGDDLVISGDLSSKLGVSGAATNGNNERAAYAKQFNGILTQIDELVQDTSYKGINLLNGDSLVVNFNETRTSTIELKGVKFDSIGLGFTQAANEWISNESIDKSLGQIIKATSMLRAQASEFGQNLSTVQIREDFTENMINNLQSGADKLTLADMNEEGANMLALQTRQQLGVNSLSLASQASQSVLKLF